VSICVDDGSDDDNTDVGDGGCNSCNLYSIPSDLHTVPSYYAIISLYH
jgi:hypothetical protein